MASQIKTGHFVHVVASLDTKSGSGKIHYVNPSTSTIASDAATDSRTEIAGLDAAGSQLFREHVILRHSSCDPGQSNDVALIQADMPRAEGLKSIVLLYDGLEVDRYNADTTGSGTDSMKKRSLGLAPASADHPNRRQLELSDVAAMGPAPGISYTVQVRTDAGDTWNTIAVGRSTPAVEVDRNQFPGAKSATVRVIRTNGFDEDVIAEGQVNIE